MKVQEKVQASGENYEKSRKKGCLPIRQWQLGI